MKTRRDLLKSAAAIGVLGATGLPLTGAAEDKIEIATGENDRRYGVSVMEKIARPVLENLARRELKKNMPLESQPGANRKSVSHLEAFGRLLCGMAPWLAAENLNGEDLQSQQQFSKLAQMALDAATDPQSPDFMNFSEGRSEEHTSE